MNMRLLSLLVLPLTLFSIACVPPTPTGTLDSLDPVTDDVDGDGFLELASCGRDNNAGTIAIRVANTITREQAIALAGQDIPDFIGVTVGMVIDRIYADGEVCTDTANEELGPFEFAVEATCPERVETSVEVLINIPLVGSQSVFSQEFTASTVDARADTMFECDKLIEVIAEIDPRTGQPTADIEVKDQ